MLMSFSFRCRGTEYYLADCERGTVTHHCDHGGDVSVVCTTPTPCNDKDKVYISAAGVPKAFKSCGKFPQSQSADFKSRFYRKQREKFATQSS